MPRLERLDMRLIGGTLLIFGGLIYLLINFGLIAWGSLIWAAAAAIGATFFFVLYGRDRQQWWWLIPGMVLAALAGVRLIEFVAPAWAAQWGGPLFLASIGLAFWLIYAFNRLMWWAFIPGGVLMTLAVVAGLDDVAGIEGGGVLFLGMGITFVLVSLLPVPDGKPNRWALIPAIVLLAMGALFLVGFERAFGYVWPVALILGGLLLLARAWRVRKV